MIKLILLRGPSAVGKTTIAKDLLINLKNKKINCAFISEDNFRKKMQFKYKAEDKITHLNSVELIKTIIKKLVEIDNYSLIIIEGLFRYEKMLANYKNFANKNKYHIIIFQLKAPIEVRRIRNKISDTRDHVADLDSEHGRGTDEKIVFKDSIIIDSTKPLKEITKRILLEIK